MKRIMVIFAVLFAAFQLSAQNTKVSGVVHDAD